MSLLDNLPHVCTISRRKRAMDSILGSKDSYTLISADVPCWKQQATTSEVKWWQARNVNVTDKVFFSQPESQNGNILQLDEGCIIDCQGSRFDVISNPKPDSSAGFGLLYRVMVQYIGKTPE